MPKANQCATNVSQPLPNTQRAQPIPFTSAVVTLTVSRALTRFLTTRYRMSSGRWRWRAALIWRNKGSVLEINGSCNLEWFGGTCLLVPLCVCVCTSLSVSLYVCLSVCMSLSVCATSLRLAIHSFIHPSIHPSVCLCSTNSKDWIENLITIVEQPSWNLWSKK